jgi:hypothetical protein
MAKPIIAFFLSILFLVIYRFFLEILGEYVSAVFVILGAYFFICQFLLSRGNLHAFRKDWPTMLALDFAPFIYVVDHAIQSGWGSLWSRAIGLWLIVGSVGGTLAGAVAASLAARRKARRSLEQPRPI